MIRFLIVSPDKQAFADLTSFLKKKADIDISWAANGQMALNIISDNPFDLVIADDLLSDMAGLGFVQKLVAINPMINSALVSTLSHDKFHQQTEGLGILTQLPKKPDEKHTKDLLKQLKKIIG
jgi:two-component SAPR family response regulator